MSALRSRRNRLGPQNTTRHLRTRARPSLWAGFPRPSSIGPVFPRPRTVLGQARSGPGPLQNVSGQKNSKYSRISQSVTSSGESVFPDSASAAS